MDFKSEYYKSLEDYMQENKITPEDSDFIVPNIKMSEDMMFGFTINLIM